MNLFDGSTYPPPTTTTQPPPTSTAGTGAPEGVTTGTQAAVGLALIGAVAVTAAVRLGRKRARKLESGE